MREVEWKIHTQKFGWLCLIKYTTGWHNSTVLGTQVGSFLLYLPSVRMMYNYVIIMIVQIFNGHIINQKKVIKTFFVITNFWVEGVEQTFGTIHRQSLHVMMVNMYNRRKVNEILCSFGKNNSCACASTRNSIRRQTRIRNSRFKLSSIENTISMHFNPIHSGSLCGQNFL